MSCWEILILFVLLDNRWSLGQAICAICTSWISTEFQSLYQDDEPRRDEDCSSEFGLFELVVAEGFELGFKGVVYPDAWNIAEEFWKRFKRIPRKIKFL